MNYLYYPGCSLEGTAKEYDASTRALMRTLEVELTEIGDWTCCGASAAEAASSLLAMTLPALNLAKAEAMGTDADILVPCSACYLNLKRVGQARRNDPDMTNRIEQALAADNLALTGRLETRHLLDVISRDIPLDVIRARTHTRIRNQLSKLTVAPYYGCQCLRPHLVFDDPEAPRSMEGVISATGATVHTWDMGGRCCGAAHMNTKPDVGMQLVADILRQARGADIIVTVCPMCQMNLEGFQGRISKRFQIDLHVTVLYLPQFLGLAMGLSPQALGIDYNLAVTDRFREIIRA